MVVELLVVFAVAVGHSRTGEVSHNNVELLPWCAWHHHCLRCNRSGLYSITHLPFVIL